MIALLKAIDDGYRDCISLNHYIIHSNPEIDNPEMSHIAQKAMSELKKFIVKYDLPVQILVSTPNLASSWTGKILSGRGLPTFACSVSRQCTHDYKISASDKLRNAYLKAVNLSLADITLLLGSRDLEGLRGQQA